MLGLQVKINENRIIICEKEYSNSYLVSNCSIDVRQLFTKVTTEKGIDYLPHNLLSYIIKHDFIGEKVSFIVSDYSFQELKKEVESVLVNSEQSSLYLTPLGRQICKDILRIVNIAFY